MTPPGGPGRRRGRVPVGSAAVLAVLGRPALWPTAIGLARRMAAPRWWSRWPPLPVPSAPYASFRLHTALGDDPEARLDPAEVVAYLEWCRRMKTWQRTDRDVR